MPVPDWLLAAIHSVAPVDSDRNLHEAIATVKYLTESNLFRHLSKLPVARLRHGVPSDLNIVSNLLFVGVWNGFQTHI